MAAEMQWQLMPPRTYAGSQVVIGAILEPAYQVGGDAFDYSLDGYVVHLAVFDSMGHDTSAGVAANLALAAYRNGRRRRLDLASTSVAVEKALIAEFGRQEFGLAQFVDFLIRHHADRLPVPETVRRLMRSLLAHHQGRLADDATSSWRSGGVRPRRPDAEGLVGLPEV